ncbi:MAG: hypothetical protein ACREUG_02535 [Steroidobacteraceae bacterium]
MNPHAGSVPAESDRTERLYALVMTSQDLDSIREALTLAHLVASERRRCSERLAELDLDRAFHARCIEYWTAHIEHAERAARVIERAQLQVPRT